MTKLFGDPSPHFVSCLLHFAIAKKHGDVSEEIDHQTDGIYLAVRTIITVGLS